MSPYMRNFMELKNKKEQLLRSSQSKASSNHTQDNIENFDLLNILKNGQQSNRSHFKSVTQDQITEQDKESSSFGSPFTQQSISKMRQLEDTTLRKKDSTIKIEQISSNQQHSQKVGKLQSSIEDADFCYTMEDQEPQQQPERMTGFVTYSGQGST